MISLAPLKYAKLLKNPHIIENVSIRSLQRMFSNAIEFEAYVKLNPLLKPKWSKAELYGNADGTGSATQKNIAVYKAISEAIERWAFYQSIENNKEDYGFDVEPTTTGLAAYPGMFARQARKFAVLEAIERWVICNWWDGNLPAIALSALFEGLSAISIETIFEDQKLCTAIVWNSKFDINFGAAYGFSTRSNRKDAYLHALTEMNRSIEALEKERKKSSKERSAFKDLFERRVLYFSTIEGRKKFLEKVDISLGNSARINIKPKVLIDKELKGPWEKYTTVWRLLLEMPHSRRHLLEEDYFVL